MWFLGLARVGVQHSNVRYMYEYACIMPNAKLMCALCVCAACVCIYARYVIIICMHRERTVGFCWWVCTCTYVSRYFLGL